MRLAACVTALTLLAPLPAAAIIGGAPAPAEIGAQTALIVSTRGASCSSAVLTRDLLLTAAHCVEPKAEYAVAVFEGGAPKLAPVARIVLHPRFDRDAFRTRRPTPDLALVKLSAPLPASYRPARLARDVFKPAPGESFTLTGYGTTREGDDKSAGKINALALPAIGNTIDATGVIMVRLSAGGKVAGACTGEFRRRRVSGRRCQRNRCRNHRLDHRHEEPRVRQRHGGHARLPAARVDREGGANARKQSRKLSIAA